MTDSVKTPELAHYNIKTQFRSLLFNSSELIKHYDDLLLKIKDSLEETSPLHELIEAHYSKIQNTNRQIKGIHHTFKRFDKIYSVEKYLNNNNEIK
ncbi:MAG: hypothetical protein FWE18_02310 [Alphaproteobacteria bacterium]|nr:hypothetical protein [Alphaproteobacteria bacterium]